jgi:arginase
MSRTIVIAGSPTALGGHFGGMERTPGDLRAAGLIERMGDDPAFEGVAWHEGGDAPNDPGWLPDPDPRAKNRSAINAYLPRLATHVATAIAAAGDPDARLLLLGGDCTSHVGAMAGLRRARPGRRFGLVWFDAHGDFNTPDTTPSGNIWGMPFAMLCGRGDEDLVAAGDGASVAEADAALVGGQVLDEPESRMLAASPVAHFGAGMVATDAGRAALEAWCRIVAARVDGWYIAFDLDAIDETEGIAVATPETGGLTLADAAVAVGIIAASGPVAGFGATAAMFGEGRGPDRAVEAIGALAASALGAAGSGVAG